MVKRILALSLLLMAGLVGCGGQQDDAADLSVRSSFESFTKNIAYLCAILTTVEEQKECSVTPEKYFSQCPFPLSGMCQRNVVEEPCEKENQHLQAVVANLNYVHEAINLTPDSSVTFDFSVSDSAIVKVEHSSSSWTFTALKAGTTSITLVRTTPGIQTCSYTQAINISE